MNYEVEIKPKAVKDLQKIDKMVADTILTKIEALKDGLSSNVKKLTNHSPEYRLRVGEYRALFEIDGDKIEVYRILHRKKAYKGG